MSTNSNTSKESSDKLIVDVNKENPEEWDEKRKEVFDNIQKELNAFPTEIEGSRKEFLERLDCIQRELDSLPDKKYSEITSLIINRVRDSRQLPPITQVDLGIFGII